MQLRRELLGEAQPAEVVLERPVGVDARLDAQLARAVVDRLVHAPRELLAVVLVGVGRALALAEAAEGAADGADVGDVDVAVDDERDRLPRELGAQLVGGLAHVLDRLRARLGEHRRQLVGAQRERRRAPARSRAATRSRRIGAGGSVRPEPRRGMKLQYFALIVSSTPVRDPLGVDVLRVHAQALGQREPSRCSSLRTWCGDGNGCSGEM